MPPRRARHHRAGWAITLAVGATLAGCGSDGPVSPLAVDVPVASAGATTPAASATPTTRPPTGPNNPGGRTPSPTPSTPSATPTTPTCGTDPYEIDVPNTELELIRPLCLHVGGILRLRNIGPGLVTTEPESLTRPSYEAGIVDIHFIGAGTVTVTIPKDGQDYNVIVVVVE